MPYVAKFPDIAAPVNRIGTEAAFYDAISGTQLTEHTPSIIGYAPESFLLCMEDLGDGADLTTIYNKGLPTELPELLTWLRTLHDLPINNPLDFANTAMRELNHAHIFSIPFSTGNGLTFNAELQDCRHALLSDELSVRVVAMGNSFPEHSEGTNITTGRSTNGVVDPRLPHFAALKLAACGEASPLQIIPALGN